MVKFFQAMKESNPEHEQKMMQVLHGGKGDMKRHYAVDNELYGKGISKDDSNTNGGDDNKGDKRDGNKVGSVVEKVKSKSDKKQAKKRDKKRKKRNEKEQNDAADDSYQTSSNTLNTTLSTQEAAIGGAILVGTIAFVATLIGGGKKNN